MRTMAKLGTMCLVLGLLVAAGCSKGTGNPGETTASIPGEKGTKESSGGTAEAGTSKARAPLPPVLEIETTMGTIAVELFPEQAPMTVRNFLTFVNERYYDGTIFHMVLNHVVLAGGYSEGTHQLKPPKRPEITNEARQCGLRNERGTIAMFRRPDTVDSVGSQFIINVRNNPELDHQGMSPEKFGYCVFGRVIQGMEVVDKIAQVEVRDETRAGISLESIPAQDVVIKTIRGRQ